MANADDTVVERLSPALATLEEKARQARRAIVKGRHKAEDLIAETQLKVRRHPIRSIALAGLVGVAAGCAVGLLMGRSREPQHRLPGM